MVALSSLWLPIVVSALVVFVASSIVHMALRYHSSDYRKLAEEDKVRAALRESGVTRGTYMIPAPDSPKEMGSEELMQRFNEGPVGLLHVGPNGAPMMPKHLAMWFGFCLLVGLFAAYLASHALESGAAYLEVFRVVGTAAVLGYCFGDLTNSIWRMQPAKTTLKNLVDGVVYSLLTAGVFGWLWPR